MLRKQPLSKFKNSCLPRIHIYFSPNGGIVKFIKAGTRRDGGQKEENDYKHFWQSRTA